MNANCLQQFLFCRERIAEVVGELRAKHPRAHLLVAMEIPPLTLLAEERRYPVSYGILYRPTVRNLLAVLEKLPAGSIVAMYPGS